MSGNRFGEREGAHACFSRETREKHTVKAAGLHHVAVGNGAKEAWHWHC
jgi:hypothetical protein